MKKKYIVPEICCIEMAAHSALLDLSQHCIISDDGTVYLRDPIDVYNTEEAYQDKIEIWMGWGAD